MSAKRRTTALVSGVLRYSAIACAKAGFELPATSLIAPFLPAIYESLPNPAFCLRMILSENRYPLFGIMRSGGVVITRWGGARNTSPNHCAQAFGQGEWVLGSVAGRRQRQRFPGRYGRFPLWPARRQRDRIGGGGGPSGLVRRRIGIGLENAEDAGGFGRGSVRSGQYHARLG